MNKTIYIYIYIYPQQKTHSMEEIRDILGEECAIYSNAVDGESTESDLFNKIQQIISDSESSDLTSEIYKSFARGDSNNTGTVTNSKQQQQQQKGWLQSFFFSNQKVIEEYELSEEELRNATQNRSALPRIFPEIHLLLPKKQIVFGGCAGMYHYFLGIAAVLQEKFNLDDVIFSSVSGGCFPSLALVLGLPIKTMHETWNHEILTELDNSFLKALTRLNAVVIEKSKKYLPVDSHIAAKDRLFISITEFPSLKNHIVHSWKSIDELLNCVLASCFIPIFDRRFWTYYDQKRYIDGGMSNNKPLPYPELPHMYITTTKWRDVPLHWYWCYTSISWSNQLFEWGREDALKNIDEFYNLGLKEKMV